MAGRPPFDQFDAELEDIESYLERLQEYFTAYVSWNISYLELNLLRRDLIH